jgi:hypothetical protein
LVVELSADFDGHIGDFGIGDFGIDVQGSIG